MLTIYLSDLELFDESTNTFSVIKGQVITLEHSLVSISKWEMLWKEPFIGKDDLTSAQIIDYIRCMTITQNVNPLLYTGITQTTVDKVKQYMDDPMTATWFRDDKTKTRSTRKITSELVYYWMIESGIPMECQKWHFNRLMTLIQVCNEERKAADSNNRKKMNPRDLARSRSALNAQRKAQLHSRG